MSVQNFAIDASNTNITTDSGVTCPINNLKEFEFEGVVYVLYNYTTTLVKHKKNTLCDIDIKYFDTPLIIEKTLAELAVNDIANITQYQLEVSDDTGNKLGSQNSLVDTLNRLKTDTLKNLSNNNAGIHDSLKQIVELLAGRIKDYDPQNMIKSLPLVTKLNKIYPAKTTSISTLLSDLVKYVVYHNNLHDAIVNNRGLTIFPDTIFLLALINVLMNSKVVLVENLLNLYSIQDLLIHSVINIAYNTITMRLDKELFIKERSSAAKAIKAKYYQSFPILTKNKDLQTLLSVLSNNPKFDTMIKEESVNMYPYIMLYGLSDKTRIKTCYAECRKNKDIEINCDQQIQWLQPDNFIETLQEFSNSHSVEYSRYDTDLFITILSKFISSKSIITSSINEEPMEH